jgi:hypothetical protein
MEWLVFARDFGLPTVLLVGLCLGLWRAGKWVGQKCEWLMENIVKPIGRRHVEHLDFLERNQAQNSQVLAENGKVLDKIADSQISMAADLKALRQSHESAREK